MKQGYYWAKMYQNGHWNIWWRNTAGNWNNDELEDGDFDEIWYKENLT
jgi:hypothetical protein